MNNKSLLLDQVRAQGEERIALAHLLDTAAAAEKRNVLAASDFLSPALLKTGTALLRAAGFREDFFFPWGGYEGAERCILLFVPDYLENAQAKDDAPLAFLRAAYREEDAPTHRDLLGSLLGLGLERRTIGDILVSPAGADLVCLASVADFILTSWESAGRCPLRVSAIGAERLHIPTPEVQEIRGTVASLRLDAVLSLGLRLSRTKAAELIAQGRVQLNYQECAHPDHAVAAGDRITARGFGRLELAELGPLSRKGRQVVTIKRYV